MNKRASIDYAKVITIWLISPPTYGHKINHRNQKFTWQRESKGKGTGGFPREPGRVVLFIVLLTRPDKCSVHYPGGSAKFWVVSCDEECC